MNDKTIENLPESGINRSYVGIVKNSDEKSIWIIGGMSWKTHELCQNVIKYDLKTKKCIFQRPTNLSHRIAGGFVTSD